jgi:hypothetical protein
MNPQVTSVSALSEDDDGHPEILLAGYMRPNKYLDCEPKWTAPVDDSFDFSDTQ